MFPRRVRFAMVRVPMEPGESPGEMVEFARKIALVEAVPFPMRVGAFAAVPLRVIALLVVEPAARWRVPAVTVVLPVYELVPPRPSVPGPVFVIEPVPETVPFKRRAKTPLAASETLKTAFPRRSVLENAKPKTEDVNDDPSPATLAARVLLPIVRFPSEWVDPTVLLPWTRMVELPVTEVFRPKVVFAELFKSRVPEFNTRLALPEPKEFALFPASDPLLMAMLPVKPELLPPSVRLPLPFLAKAPVPDIEPLYVPAPLWFTVRVWAPISMEPAELPESNPMVSLNPPRLSVALTVVADASGMAEPPPSVRVPALMAVPPV